MSKDDDPIELLAALVVAGRVIRHDGPYERHYPERRDRMVKMVEARIRLNSGR